MPGGICDLHAIRESAFFVHEFPGSIWAKSIVLNCFFFLYCKLLHVFGPVHARGQADERRPHPVLP